MLYLIGGGARAGKSTLARTLRLQLTGAQSLSGDSLRQVLKHHIAKNTHGGFDLRDQLEYINYYTHHASEEITNLEQQAEAIAPYLSTYIDSIHLETNDDLIIESVDIWPSFVRQIKQPYKVIFLIDTSKSQWQRIKQCDDEYSWLLGRRLSDDQLTKPGLYLVLHEVSTSKSNVLLKTYPILTWLNLAFMKPRLRVFLCC